LMILVTHAGSSLRKRALQSLSERDDFDQLGPELARLLEQRGHSIGQLTYIDGLDRGRCEVLLEAFRARYLTIVQFLRIWLNVDDETDLSPFLTRDRIDAVDETNRPVQLSVNGLYLQAVADVLNQQHIPECFRSMPALLLRAVMGRIRKLPFN